MYKAFEQFGEVDDVEYTGKEFTVRFTPEDDGENLASGSLEHQVKHLKIETSGSSTDSPDQNSPDHILNALDDDCLMEIFEQLPVRDLYAMAWVCKRFRPIAVRAYHSRYKNESFDWADVDAEYGGSRLNSVSLSVFVDFLRIFGPTSVNVPACFSESVTLGAIAEYCPNLKELKCNKRKPDFRLDPDAFAFLRPILPKLRKIAIPAASILDICGDVDWQLEELGIDLSGYKIPKIKSPRLIKLSLFGGYRCSTRHNAQSIFKFLARNGQLKVLELGNCTFSWAQWCKLSECLPHLETLSFDKCTIENYDDRVPGILPCLTACKYDDCELRHFVELVRGAPLERFRLFGLVDERDDERIIMDSICRMTSLTSLYLGIYSPFDYVSDDTVRRLMHSLGCLQELHIPKSKVTLGGIQHILSESNQITKLDVAFWLDEKVDLKPAVLDNISANIAARPELHVQYHIPPGCLKVSELLFRNLTDLLLTCVRSFKLGASAHFSPICELAVS